MTAPTTEPTRDDDLSLTFREPVDLGSKARPGAVGTRCQDSVQDGDCGLGEAQVEVDSRGVIYVSGVCCLTVAPPVYVSRDNGTTFTLLETPGGVREAFGIEGDFAIDATGTVYFADIEFAGTFQVTVWDKDGAFVRHTKWPAPPLVDRDWIRADGDGHLYYVYNTGTSTNVYTSTDAGETWSPAPAHTSPFNLGNAIAGAKPGELWIAGAGGDKMVVDATMDGGATWGLETSTVPGSDAQPVGTVDEAGRLYLASQDGDAIVVGSRPADGTWGEPVTVSGEGRHQKPWMASGRDGVAVVAWYGTNATATDVWSVHVAYTENAGRTWTTHLADARPVFTGDLGDDLLDFFQVELGPDGAIHVAYSRVPDGEGNEEQLTYVRSDADARLAAGDYRNGP